MAEINKYKALENYLTENLDEVYLEEVDYDKIPTDEDWKDLYVIFSDETTLINVAGSKTPTLPITKENTYKENRMLRSERQAGLFYMRSKNHKNRIIGCVDILGFYKTETSRQNVIITYMIHRDFRDQGYGKKLIAKTIEICNNKNNIHKLVAQVFSYNSKSLHVLKSQGFVTTGVSIDGIKFENKFYDIISTEYIKGLRPDVVSKRAKKYLNLLGD